MSATRPPYRPTRPEPEPEDLFNVTVVFNDDEPPIDLSEVTQSEVLGMYNVLGAEGARMRFTPTPGFHYFTAASRIKHMTATLITETSN